MFDIGFTELMLLGVVALLVLGPERLPAAARTAGLLLRRARNSYQSLKNDIERELAAEEMRANVKSMAEPIQSIKQTASELNRGAAELSAELKRSDPIAEPASVGESAEPRSPSAETDPLTELADQASAKAKAAAAKVDADDAFIGSAEEPKDTPASEAAAPPAADPERKD